MKVVLRWPKRSRGVMIPVIVIGVVEQTLRLINNIIEGKPPEQREAEALVGYHLFRTIIGPLLPAEVRDEMDKLVPKKGDHNG